MNIKKQFQAIHSFLEDNKAKKVSTILSELTSMMEAKVASKTFILDDEGNVESIYCYYHKEWELVANTPYGVKASTASGLNTMCKQGVSHWTKQQRVLKVGKSQLLDDVADGSILAEEIPSLIELLEEEAKRIEPYSEE